MGYRYGDHRYSERLYSRWPDWWQPKDCTPDVWDDVACLPPAWATVPPPERPQWVRGDQQARMTPKERTWRRTR